MKPEEAVALRRPFDPEAIGTLPRGGVQLQYVGHANVTDRLLDVDPEWCWEPASFDPDGQPCMVRDESGQPVGLWIRLTVCGVTRYGYGSLLAPKAEGVKELIGDAIRNAAMRFGVALDLWKKEEAHEQGRPTGTAPKAGPDTSAALKAAQDAWPAESQFPSCQNHGALVVRTKKNGEPFLACRQDDKTLWPNQLPPQVVAAMVAALAPPLPLDEPEVDEPVDPDEIPF